MADGTIVIDTRIDESSLPASLKKIDGAVKGTAEDMQKYLDGITFDKNGRARDAMGRFVNVITDANGKVIGLGESAKKTSSSVGGLGEKLGGLGSSLGGLAGLATSIFAGFSIGSFAQAALKSTADIELAQSKMETLLGSAEKSQYLISQIVKMADTTPYDSNTLIQAATTLKGFGVAAQDIMPTLTALGNASGGVADQMSRVAVVFGQVKAQGKMMGNDFFQFINAGVPIVEVLAQGLHKSVSEIQALRESGGITFDMLNKAFAEMYTGSGKWAGLMEKAAKTLPGMWSTLQDSSMAFGRSIVGVLEPALKNLMDIVTKLFTAGVKWVENNKDLVEVIGKMAGVIVIASVAIGAITAAQWAWNLAMSANPVGAVIEGLIVFTGLVVVATQKFDQWGAAVLAILGPIGMLVEQIKVLYDHWKKIEESFSSKGILQGILEIGKALVDSMILPIQQLLSYMTWVPEFGPQAKAAAAGLQKFRESYLSAKKVVETPVKKAKTPDLFEQKGMTSQVVTAEMKKYQDAQKALYDETNKWLIESGMERTDIELTNLSMEYDKKLDIAQGNNALLLMIQSQYEQQRQDIIKKNLKYAELYSMLTGFGMSEGLARGLAEGTYTVVSAVKTIGMNIARAFDNIADFVGKVFRRAFDILSWMSDFSPSEIYDSFKGFIDGLSDFFTNDIGSLPIFFDMGVKVFEDFINGMIQNLPAIVETIGNVVDHIVNYFIENGPKIIEQIFTIIFALFDKLTDKIPQIINAVMTIVNAIIEKLPMIVDKLLNALVIALESFGDNAEKFASTIVSAIAGILDSIANNIGPLLTAVIQIILSLIKGIIEKLPVLIPSIVNLIKSIILAIVDAIPVIIQALPGLITALIEAIIQLLDEHEIEKIVYALVIGIIKAIPQIIKAIVLAIGDIFTQSIPALFKGLYDVGKNIVLGIMKGFTDYAPRLWDAIKGFFTGLIDKVKGLFGIHSPSTVFASIGADCIRGFINGVLSLANSLKNLFANVFSSVFSFLSGLVSKFASIGSTFASALVDGFTSIGGSLADVLVDVLQSAVTCLVFGLRDVVFGWIKEQVMSMIGTIADSVWPSIKKKVEKLLPGGGGKAGKAGKFFKKHFASGTNYAPGGVALVGEQGPELVNLPRGSQVFTAAETKAMLSGKGYQSLVNGLSGGLSMSPALASSGVTGGGMTIRNIMTGTVQVDGRTLARIVYENLDKVHKAAYGN